MTQTDSEVLKKLFSQLPIRTQWFLLSLVISPKGKRADRWAGFCEAICYRRKGYSTAVLSGLAKGVSQLYDEAPETDWLKIKVTHREPHPGGSDLLRAVLSDGRIVVTFTNQLDWQTVLYWELTQ